jgi:hypothetical protein
VHPRTGHEGHLGARWGWVVNATPRPLYPRERPGTHSIGGWVGHRAGLDRCGKSLPQPGFDPRTESLYRLRCHCPLYIYICVCVCVCSNIQYTHRKHSQMSAHISITFSRSHPKHSQMSAHISITFSRSHPNLLSYKNHYRYKLNTISTSKCLHVRSLQLMIQYSVQMAVSCVDCCNYSA